MPDINLLERSVPVAPLRLAVLDSIRPFGEKVNDHIVNMRKEGVLPLTVPGNVDIPDSYFVSVSCPRFGTGEAKGTIKESVRGCDLYIMTDITRDAIDTVIRHNHQEYVFIDTAGLRRKNKITEDIERYSIIRTVTAVERCDVVVIVIDAIEGITEQDAKIAGVAHERGKGIIIAVNKWDGVEKTNKTFNEYTEKVRNTLSFMQYAEIVFVSALTGQRLPKLFDMIDKVVSNQTLRVQTGVLNEILMEAVAMQQPPSDKGKRLKIFYMTQVSVKPPTFVLFVNDKELMHFSYLRYLENRLREAFGFSGTPIHFIVRERGQKEQ